MNVINKRIASSRIRFNAGVLEDSSTSIITDDMGLPLTAESITASVFIKINSESPVPSSIGVSIVDNNTIISKTITSGDTIQSPHILVDAALNEHGPYVDSATNEVTINLLNGEPDLSVSINSNDPTITSTLTASYRVTALKSN
jgi:hypothetical protein